MRKILLPFFLLIVFSFSANASISESDSLAKQMGAMLEDITVATSWKSFVTNHPTLFPPLTTRNTDINVTVEKENVQVGKKDYDVGTAYRQLLLKATATRVKTLLSRPDLFQIMYGLDKPTAPSMNLQPGDTLPSVFEASIYKHLPSILPDQDYKLHYSSKSDGNIWFQRVTQISDASDFALRETLVIVESLDPDRTVFREIGRLYPQQWLIRQMGPTLRKITKDELKKASATFACVAESTQPLSESLAKDCAAKN